VIQVTQLPLIPFFTLPYVRAWAEKCRDQGLVVIGVHTAEFSFEKNADNVRWAVKDMKIGFPVATDREFEIQFLNAGAAVFDFTFG